jgi:hypothetical protein
MHTEASVTSTKQPMFLRSVDDLQAHIQEHFEKLVSSEKGDRFASFAARLVETLPQLSEFGTVYLSSKKSHDGGIDGSSAPTEDGRRLLMQSKLSVKTKEDIDSILSKFESREKEEEVGPAQRALQLSEQNVAAMAFYVIVTAQRTAGIMERYRHSSMSSRPFYDQLIKQGRLYIVDGEVVFTAIQTAFSRAFGRPNTFPLTSAGGWLHCGSVYLGFLRAGDLVSLYRKYGDSLFYENVRDWLGPTSGKKAPDQLTVNQEISQTIKTAPTKLLERNNGITFKARRVSPDLDKLELEEASVVNGCQTTMAIVTSSDRVDDCMVQVKVIESADAWDVAKAANYQNPVPKINLELAPYIRPQLVREAAAESGIKIEDAAADNAVSLLNSLYKDRLQYEELRYLYIGMLSITPNNIITQSYTMLRADLLGAFAQDTADRRLVMEAMFALTLATRKVVAECRNIFGSEDAFGPFMRVFEHEKPQYRMFLAILAISALLAEDISERRDGPDEMSRMRNFMNGIRKLLVQEPQKFRAAYMMALSTLATGAREGNDDDAKVRQRLATYVARNFRQLYASLIAQIAVDRQIHSTPNA